MDFVQCRCALEMLASASLHHCAPSITAANVLTQSIISGHSKPHSPLVLKIDAAWQVSAVESLIWPRELYTYTTTPASTFHLMQG